MVPFYKTHWKLAKTRITIKCDIHSGQVQMNDMDEAWLHRTIEYPTLLTKLLHFQAMSTSTLASSTWLHVTVTLFHVTVILPHVTV